MLIAVPGAINQRRKPEDAPNTIGQTRRTPYHVSGMAPGARITCR